MLRWAESQSRSSAAQAVFNGLIFVVACFQIVLLFASNASTQQSADKARQANALTLRLSKESHAPWIAVNDVTIDEFKFSEIARASLDKYRKILGDTLDYHYLKIHYVLQNFSDAPVLKQMVGWEALYGDGSIRDTSFLLEILEVLKNVKTITAVPTPIRTAIAKLIIW